MPRGTKTQKHVGVLVETEDTWGRNIVEAVCRFGQTARWTILIAPRDSQGKLRLPRIWNGHGVIAALRNRPTVTHLKKLQVPVVDVSSTMKKESWFARVNTDDRMRAQLAVEHLSSRGITNFACYAPSIGRYSDTRVHEFQACVESLGHQCSIYTTERGASAGWLTNYTNAREWLMRLDKPVGVFAGDPYPARQLIEVCAMNSIRVPDEVAILSGDNDDLLCSVATPQITSIELASHRIGETAAKLLERLMNGAKIPQQTKMILPLGIRQRQSTDMLAIDDPDLVKALSYIRQHAKDGISVRDVAQACYLSRRTLEQRFRVELDRSPGEEIRRTRLEVVRRLLLDTDKSIAAIAYETGFASGASLTQAFQQYFGTSPGRFRQLT
ncbi:AraC family transcriptional regulator [Calycomorphotria hydatis]|uniref:Xylose operon regulatory protein n=1 Tax=Calycomorphotria hydatis TaxID=2528027 RepID=A0A517T5F7_9PLAN|nr:XylR family transcriptional regulator [Calycomorphotria hydatis]QDT63598.1 Xylose operon regulatory protein [Calycomorphotria hydatis]